MHPTLLALLTLLRDLPDGLSNCFNMPPDSIAPIDAALSAWRDAKCPSSTDIDGAMTPRSGAYDSPSVDALLAEQPELLAAVKGRQVRTRRTVVFRGEGEAVMRQIARSCPVGRTNRARLTTYIVQDALILIDDAEPTRPDTALDEAERLLSEPTSEA